MIIRGDTRFFTLVVAKTIVTIFITAQDHVPLVKESDFAHDDG
jgi:hypothetical protein